jgi:hypothetical protein
VGDSQMLLINPLKLLRAIFDQLMEFLNNHFNPLLSAFRSGFGCQTALLRIIEDWKKALDDNKFIAAILMDLQI